MQIAESQGELAYIHMAVIPSSLVQRNSCIEQIILIETKTFAKECGTHALDAEDVCICFICL